VHCKYDYMYTSTYSKSGTFSCLEKSTVYVTISVMFDWIHGFFDYLLLASNIIVFPYANRFTAKKAFFF